MRKLLQLMAANPRRTGVRVEAAADGEATVYVYDAIGPWGLEASTFVQSVAPIQASVIHLRINSPGGDVFDARAMKTALQNHPAKVIAHIDGLSASAASFLMMAADEIEIADGAFVMIHEPWGLAIGNAGEMRETATLLDRVNDAIVNDYLGRTGKAEADVRAWMAAETWFTAAEAVENGFADRISGKPSANAAFDLSAYRNAPKALAAAAPDTFAAFAGDRQRYEARLALYERAA